MSRLTRRFGIPRFAWLALLLTLAVPAHAMVVKQLTDVKRDTFQAFPALDAAGTTVYTSVSTDLFGTNPEHAFQLVKFDAITGSSGNVAFFEEGVANAFRGGFSVSDDNVWLAFISDGDLTGQNHDRSDELFVVRTDGTDLAQLTSDPGPTSGSVLSIVLAGGGAKVFFVSNSDPLGTNPAFEQQLFAVNRDGTGLAQLTALVGGGIPYFDASDDGTRVTFVTSGDPLGTNADGNRELFAINGDGTNLRQLTSTTGPGMEVPQIAGNGSTIALHSENDPFGTNADGFWEVFAIEWDGTNFRQLTDTTTPLLGPGYSAYVSITDDGRQIFYASNHGDFPFPPGGQNVDGSFEIFRINSDGTGRVPVTDFGLSGGQNYYQGLSGDGSRMSFLRYGDPCDGSAGPNDLYQLCVATTSGTGMVQLLVSDTWFSFEPDVSPDGNRVVFGSNADLTGGDPDHVGQIYLIDRDGSNLTQLTSFTTGFYSQTPSIADTGTIVFTNNNNDDALNSSLVRHVMRVFSDGSGLIRLTGGATQDSYLPAISRDGTTVVFSTASDLTGGNADGSFEVFKVNSDGTGMTQLSFTSAGAEAAYARVDASGTWVVFASNGDLTGGNADGSTEIFRVRTDGSGLQQITAYPSSAGSAIYPDISGAGDLLIMSLNFDFGNNPDHGYDVYTWDATNGLVQRTAVDGDAYPARLSDDGTYAYFVSDGSFTETDPDGRKQVFRLELSGGAVERVDGLGFGSQGYGFFAGPVYSAATDASGDVAAYGVAGEFTMDNRDRSSEIVLIDRVRWPAQTISGGSAPTTFDWEVESGPIRYDAIRGDVANLAPGGPGEIDLGPVVCLEDDKPTPGAEDAVTPAVGQVFFYLRRGSQGVTAGPGSYGEGSDGSERIAGPGGCN